MCSLCTRPATTMLRYHDAVERYCDKHWEERRKGVIAPVICEDCGI